MPNVRNVVDEAASRSCGLDYTMELSSCHDYSKDGVQLWLLVCTVVIKAPAETPFSVLAIAHLAEQIGIPKGVINIVTAAKGDNEAAVGKEMWRK